MHDTQGHDVKRKKPVTEGQIPRDSTYREVPEQSHSQTEIGWCAPGAGSQYLAGGDGATATRTYLTPLNSALKIDQNGQFYVTYILPQLKKNPESRGLSSSRADSSARSSPTARAVTPEELAISAVPSSVT